MESDPTGLFFFDPESLLPLAKARSAEFRRAEPFPHVVIDEILPSRVADEIARDFPTPSCRSFQLAENAFQRNKLSGAQKSCFRGVAPSIRHLLNELNGKVFLDFLETLTGIEGLIPDPHFEGGALHQILPGGRLAVHADFNRDLRRRLHRRLNVLLYLNPEWRPEYGGDLELWDRRMERCQARIAPLLNRCVIFQTSSTSYHGHPEPLACPEKRTRNSLAIYYYSTNPGPEETVPHGTLWKQRPHERRPSRFFSVWGALRKRARLWPGSRNRTEA